MKPISSIAAQAIEEALARLAVHPGNGKLTAARLAAEAGVSRATLYRAPDLLRRLRDLSTTGRKTLVTATDRIRELEALVTELRGRESDQPRELRTANRHMAQHIQVLSLLVQDQQRRLVPKSNAWHPNKLPLRVECRRSCCLSERAGCAKN